MGAFSLTVNFESHADEKNPTNYAPRISMNKGVDRNPNGWLLELVGIENGS